MKHPDGVIFEEFVTASSYHFENGKLTYRQHITEDGQYTGRFWFCYSNGKTTRIYTRKTAPKWLLAMLNVAIQ